MREGYSPQKACECAIKRISKEHYYEDAQICFLAMNKKGEFGAYSLKKGFEFMPLKERVKIIEALRIVDEVFVSIDEDRSVCKSIEAIKPHIFAKGGDRYSGEIPEGEICRRIRCEIVDGLGKKIQSSSDLVARAKEIKKKIEEDIEKIPASEEFSDVKELIDEESDELSDGDGEYVDLRGEGDEAQ